MAAVECKSLIYCGNKALDPSKFHRVGTPYECMQKGFGAGAQSTLASYSLEMIPSWSTKSLAFLIEQGMRPFGASTSRERKFKRVVRFLHAHATEPTFLINFINNSIKYTLQPHSGNILSKKYNALITFLSLYASRRPGWAANVGQCMDYE